MVESLKALFRKTFGDGVESVVPIREDGSDRSLFRLRGGGRSVVGVFHHDHRENAAFVAFTNHFRSLGLPVPEIIAASPGEGIYLETDLGDETLADRIAAAREGGAGRADLDRLYEAAVRALPHFQIRGHRGLDYAHCYQHDRFIPETAEFDILYFRGSFLELVYTGPWDTAALNADAATLVDHLAAAKGDYFLYRDFQARNIMLTGDDELRFIDYQSGRRGPLPYDLAAFLYSSRSGIPNEDRSRWVDVYLDEASSLARVDCGAFRAQLPGFAFIRILQALGAYGNLGLRKGKRRFLAGIPGALDNLGHLMAESDLAARYPAFCDVLKRMIDSPAHYMKVPVR